MGYLEYYSTVSLIIWEIVILLIWGNVGWYGTIWDTVSLMDEAELNSINPFGQWRWDHSQDEFLDTLWSMIPSSRYPFSMDSPKYGIMMIDQMILWVPCFQIDFFRLIGSNNQATWEDSSANWMIVNETLNGWNPILLTHWLLFVLAS